MQTLHTNIVSKRCHCAKCRLSPRPPSCRKCQDPHSLLSGLSTSRSDAACPAVSLDASALGSEIARAAVSEMRTGRRSRWRNRAHRTLAPHRGPSSRGCITMRTVWRFSGKRGVTGGLHDFTAKVAKARAAFNEVRTQLRALEGFE
ncbi:hypothetical protein SRHO_G00283690 [Serrasalmus rhombeus]